MIAKPYTAPLDPLADRDWRKPGTLTMQSISSADSLPAFVAAVQARDTEVLNQLIGAVDAMVKVIRAQVALQNYAGIRSAASALEWACERAKRREVG